MVGLGGRGTCHRRDFEPATAGGHAAEGPPGPYIVESIFPEGGGAIPADEASVWPGHLLDAAVYGDTPLKRRAGRR